MRLWSRQLSVCTALVLAAQLQGTVAAVTTCPQAQCLFFPHVARAPVVRINASLAGGTPSPQLNFILVGDVINLSSYPLYNVTLSATLRDRSNGMTELNRTEFGGLGDQLPCQKK